MHSNILTPWQVFTVSEKKVLWGKVNAVTGQVNALLFPEGFSLIWAGGWILYRILTQNYWAAQRD